MTKLLSIQLHREPQQRPGGVVAPSVIYKVEPRYLEEALKAKHQDEVWLSVSVDETLLSWHG